MKIILEFYLFYLLTFDELDKLYSVGVDNKLHL
jgi:hypothetical protein